MPKYQSGKAIRQALTAQEIFKFHEQQYFNTFNKKQATKKGKRPVKRQEEQEALGLAPLPSITLAPLRALSSVALAQADVFFEILNKIAKIMKIFVKVDLLHSYAAPY